MLDQILTSQAGHSTERVLLFDLQTSLDMDVYYIVDLMNSTFKSYQDILHVFSGGKFPSTMSTDGFPSLKKKYIQLHHILMLPR